MQSLGSDGTLKSDTVGAPQLKPQSVTAASIADGQVTAPKLAAGVAADGQVLSYASGALSWITPASGPSSIAAADITDSTAIGRAILTAADASAVRTTIGAGTSNLVIGTTSTTAKAGDYRPTADQVTETSTNKVFTAAERTKLAAIETGATANDSDAQLRSRATHTGTQPLSTISDVTATATELNYSSGLTSAVHAQLNTKGDVTGPTSFGGSAVAVFNGTTGKLLKSSPTTILTDTGILSTTATTNLLFKGTGTSGGAGLGLYSDNNIVQTNGNRLGFVLFGGATDSANTVVNSGGLFAYADATWTTTSSPTRLEFEVSPSGATAMTIKPGGSVGIGTSSPGAKLEVNGEARVTTAGTNVNSVVTVGGTQTLSNKTISGTSILLQILRKAQ